MRRTTLMFGAIAFVLLITAVVYPQNPKERSEIDAIASEVAPLSRIQKMSLAVVAPKDLKELLEKKAQSTLRRQGLYEGKPRNLCFLLVTLEVSRNQHCSSCLGLKVYEPCLVPRVGMRPLPVWEEGTELYDTPVTLRSHLVEVLQGQLNDLVRDWKAAGMGKAKELKQAYWKGLFKVMDPAYQEYQQVRRDALVRAKSMPPLTAVERGGSTIYIALRASGRKPLDAVLWRKASLLSDLYYQEVLDGIIKDPKKGGPSEKEWIASHGSTAIAARYEKLHPGKKYTDLPRGFYDLNDFRRLLRISASPAATYFFRASHQPSQAKQNPPRAK